LNATANCSRRALLAAGLTMAAPAFAATDDLPWNLPPLRTVDVGGQPIAYFEAGSGPPLVLVHGFSGSASFEWGRVIGPLAKRFRVIAPYQIGFAPSAKPDLPYDAATYVDALGGLMRALKVTDATLAGESFGGWVVGHYAVAQAERRTGPRPLPPIARLVIVDGAVGMRPADHADGSADGFHGAALKAKALAWLKASPIADNNATKAKTLPNMLADMVTVERLAAAKVPTLIFWGDDDHAIPLAVGRRIAAGLPGSRLVVVPDCGHIPPIEQPEVFMRELTAFAGR